jgi:MFS family permease
MSTAPTHSKTIGYLLWIFGFMGAHRFYYGRPLTGTLWSFVLVALAFVARPLGTVLFTLLDRRHGRVTKLTVALFLLGTSTVAMGLVPSYETAGWWSIAMLALLRIGQGLARCGDLARHVPQAAYRVIE